MRVLSDLRDLEPSIGPTVLSIGNFDGVHIAHQALLAECRAWAKPEHIPVVVLTFDPHPLTVVAPARAPQALMPLDEKLRHLDEHGVDMVVVAKSEPGLLGLEAEAFVEEVIWKRFRPAHLVEGPTFGFGRGRTGNVALLSGLARRFGYQLHVVEPVSIRWNSGESVLVCSSLIRTFIAEGRVQEASECLGRDYRLFGTVIRGHGRGRKIGVPTANLEPDNQVLPGDGVYAGRTWVSERRYSCAISVGRTPTFGAGRHQIEAHLLDFAGDLYGERLSLEFVRFLRSQRRFSSPEELRTQLDSDIDLVRRMAVPMGERAHAP